MRRRRRVVAASCVLAIAAFPLVLSAGAGAAKGHKGKAARSATPVFGALLTPRREVPQVEDLKARAVGGVTLDLTRNASGVITSGEVIFYVNYDFPGPVTITGLHVHKAGKGTIGPVVLDSGVAAFTDADGDGNVTTVVTGVDPALLQAILDDPRGYYLNLHTSLNPAGALRDQLRGPVGNPFG